MTNYVKFDAISDAGNQTINRIELRSEVAGAIQNPTPADPPVPAGTSDIWLRLTKTGDQLHRRVLVRRRRPGRPFAGGAVANPMADPDFGLFAFAPQATGVGDTVSFDYFTLDGEDPPSGCECVAAPATSSTAAALDKTKWNAIVREDDTKYALSGRRAARSRRSPATSTPTPIRRAEPATSSCSRRHAGADWVIETKVSGR